MTDIKPDKITNKNTDHHHILRVDCEDQPGLVAAVANCLHKNDCNIEHAAQFNDKLSGRFFMRVVFSALSAQTPKDDIAAFIRDFETIGTHFKMDWSANAIADKPRTMLMVSKHDHCLHDLLYRWRTDHLPIDITAIVSNHDDARPHAERYGLPFHVLPVTKDNKKQQEKALRGLIEDTNTECVVLARYMQVLSDDLCNDYHGRIINIHHSFLPGFKGARPYHQAYERGVKLIGATAHFATADLDEGPIIDQQTARVNHSVDAAQMQKMGRDTEAQVLARAIQYYAERRIFITGNRTVIL